MKSLAVRSFIALLSLVSFVASGLPAMPEPRSLAGRLAEKVLIRRDSYGVPHILAETEEAMAFALGYAQAEDHAAEIARRFITARGEQARFFGINIESDFRMKRYANHEVARARFAELTPLFQSMMEAYAEGFNLYVREHRDELPGWIPVFDGRDVLAQGRAEVMRFAFDEAMIRAIQMKYPADRPAGEIRSPLGRSDEQPAAEDLMGSNMIALAPSRTVSGKTILMGNPHQAWSALYWEAHITVPGKVNFYGSTFVGRPVLTTGFNEHLGWSHTVNYPDLADVLALPLDPDNPAQYIFEGKAHPLTKKEIVVEIKESDGSMREQRRNYYYSHLGPVVHQTVDKVFALKSAILDEFRYYQQWYEMSKARSLEEFTSILKKNQIPMFNIAYADAGGNIMYLWNGTVPRRAEGIDYRAEVPGETGRYVWKDLLGFDHLPKLINPAGGYVQNCNDPPWWTSLQAVIDRRKYPSYIEPGRRLQLRTQMALEMLAGNRKFSLEDVKRMKYESRMLLADRVKPDLIKAIRAVPAPSEDLRRGLAVIESWDNSTSRAARGAVLFKRFWDTYTRENKNPYRVAWDEGDPARTPRGLSDAKLAARLFEEAVRWTRQTYGSEAIAWGDVHRVRLGDLDLPVGGESGLYGLFRVMQFATAKDGKHVVGEIERGQPLAGGGDGWIFAVEFSKPVRAYSVLAYGETRNPASKHSTDQAALFANEQYKKALFTEPEIKANLERSYRPGR
jgi:acyl-homoserine-lactone acylase